MEENNIDKYFKDRLESHVESPSAAVWDGIDAELSGVKDVKGAVLHWRTVALMSLALLLLVSGLFYWRMHRLDQENSALELALTEERIASDQISKPPSSAQETHDIDIAEHNNQAPVEARDKQTQDVMLNIDRMNPKDALDEGQVSRVNEIPPVLKDIGSDGSSSAPKVAGASGETGATGATGIEGVEGVEGNEWGSGLADREEKQSGGFEFEPVELEPSSDTVQDDIDDFTEKDNLLPVKGAAAGVSIALNQGVLEPNKYLPLEIEPLLTDERLGEIDNDWPICGGVLFLSDPKWTVGIAAYQNNTFRRIKTTSAEVEQLRSDLNRMERASTSIGFRGYLSKRLGKRTSLTFGLDYSQWQQEGSYRITFQPGSTGTEISTVPTEYSFDSELVTSTSTDEVLLQAIFAPGEEPWLGDLGTSPLSYYEVQVDRKEQITFISTPLTFRYQTYLRRLGLQGGVGLAYDLILNSNSETRISGDFEDSSVSNTAFQKDGFITAHAEVGLFYRFSERNKIHIGPRFKSWLIPLYENEGLRTYPYSNAIEIGIEIGL